MNDFGTFLYALRKEKGVTQSELAEVLGVTYKAVSKWETGDALPATGLLQPIAEYFGVTVDELLNGRRNIDGYSAPPYTDDKQQPARDVFDDIRGHLFTRGKDDDENKTFADAVCGALCAAIVLLSIAVYLVIGVFWELWDPYWVIIPVSALSDGMIGILFHAASREKRLRDIERGKHPYVGAFCGIFMLACIMTYLLLGALGGLWDPYWIILIGGVVVCGVTGACAEIPSRKRRKSLPSDNDK